ncbi:MAG TPA: SDR family NAD(P)-dependent oxidoreductase, partial [Acidimicrobiales bacterium]|nr:SDR family NAD(P)-dependent oxidoreductase [Acidimicrobiales bacterium]
MIDSFGQPQSVLVLGGASDIALATVQELVSRRCRSVVLAGRRPEVLDQAANQIRRYGPGFPESAGKELDTLAPGQPEDPEFLPRAQEHLRVDTAYFDALDFRSHERVIADVFQRFGEMDLVIIAFGILGDNIDPTEDPEGAARIIDVNFAGAVSAILSTVTQLREQGHGKIVVLSSVAGLRVRKS